MRLLRTVVIAVLAGSAACAGVLGIESVGYGPAGDGGVEASVDGAAADGSTDGALGDVEVPDGTASDATSDAGSPDLCADLDASAYLDVADVLVVPPSLVCDDGGGSIIPTTDPTNCGRCGQKCASGGCTGGTCDPEVLDTAPGVGQITVFAVQDRVYWSRAAPDGGTIRAAARDGGPSITVVDGPGTPPVKAAALMGTTVYFAGNTGLYSVPASGGPPAPFTHAATVAISELAATKNTLFWLDRAVPSAGWVDIGDTAGATLSTPPAGPGDLVSSDGAAFWLQGADLYTADDAMRRQVVYTKLFTPDTVALDPRYAYLYDPATREVVRLARNGLGAGPVPVGRLPGLAQMVTRMATDDKNVYAIAGRANASTGFSLVEVPKCGGAPFILASNVDITPGIVATGGFVYYATLAGQVVRVPR
jgi:hypothetical protein